jgi:hypothetical protein
MAPDGDDEVDEKQPFDPDELDITDDEHVKAIDENRFVVSPSDPITETERSPEPAGAERGAGAPPTRERANPEGDDDQAEPELTDERVHDWLKSEMSQTSTAYAFDVTARFDDSVGSHRIQSDDVVSAFESLLLWSARQLDDTTAAESVLGILLTESNLAVRYPPGTLAALVEQNGLGREDTIGDLLDAANDETGVVFPPAAADVRRR